MLRAAQLLLRETKSVIGPETTSPAGLIFSGFSTASNFQRLAGKVAIITGAASGIGKATAAEFFKNGAKVIIADIQDELGHLVASELGPDAAAYTRCDVTDEAQVAAAVDLAVRRHGHLDIFYSNAGIGGRLPQDDMMSVDLDNFDRVMAVNARPLVAAIKHAARVMAPRRSGCILCTSSSAGVVPVPAAAVYSISKATLIAIVRSTAEPLARHGLRVNAISPGFTQTPMLLQEIPRVTELSPGLSEEVKRTVETKDGNDAVAVLDPEEIARAAVYLASDEARYVNGHNLVVDAGYSVQKGAENSPSPAR